MNLKSIYREIVNEHNLHPAHKGDLVRPSYTLQGMNPTCGDDIYLQVSLDEQGIITEASFNGSGCAVSQASTDIMLDMMLGKSREDALAVIEQFYRMVKGELSEEEIEALDEAAALKDVAHMPARAKCATLAWHTMEKLLSEQ